MSKSLVIVESPAKAKTISKYLGNEYIVKSSVGHIRDLPKGKSKAKRQNSIPKDASPEEKATGILNFFTKTLTSDKSPIQKSQNDLFFDL